MITCGSGHKVSTQSVLAMNLEEDERFICIWRTHGGSKISIKSSFMEDTSLSVHSAEAMCQANVFVRSKLPTRTF